MRSARFRSAWLTEIPARLETYRTAFAEPGRLATIVVIEYDGTVIGDLMLRGEDAWAQVEVAAQGANTQAELGWSSTPTTQVAACHRGRT